MEKSITKRAYLAGVCVVLASAYSQYLIGGLSPILAALVVYGVPLLVTSLLWGSTIARKAFSQAYRALKFGLAFFGVFTVLGTVAGTVISYIILTLDPTAVSLLQRPNPVLHVSPEFAWIMTWVSFLVVAPAEEYLFRGFIYGGLLNLLKGRHWLGLAFISSVLFAAAHLYYAFVYGITSLVQFADLVTFGMAMAITYYLSGGNLLVPAIIHGAYDATGFIGVATSPGLGILLRGSLILIGIIVSLSLLGQRMLNRRVARQERGRLQSP